ncbi:MAG: hypothetical protein QW273_03980 [Candidatus Pacearchaeota archaeon]
MSSDIERLVKDIIQDWKYLKNLTEGKEVYLYFFEIEEEKKEVYFYKKEFLEYFKIPEEIPLNESLLLYSEGLKAIIRKKEEDLLDFAITSNATYLEHLCKIRNKNTKLLEFIEESDGKIRIKKKFREWAEITKEEIEKFSNERKKTKEESEKEIFLNEVLKEIEKLEEGYLEE